MDAQQESTGNNSVFCLERVHSLYVLPAKRGYSVKPIFHLSGIQIVLLDGALEELFVVLKPTFVLGLLGRVRGLLLDLQWLDSNVPS